MDVTEIAYNYTDLNEHNVYNIRSCPTKGDVKPLVIPIWFTDSENYIDLSLREGVRDDIDATYFGTREETGWHSMRSFYEAESCGMLNIEGVTSEWYEVGKPSTAYYSNTDGRANTNALVKEAVDWYFTNNPSERRIAYDSDLNGYLDAVMLIYAAPCYPAFGADAPNLWAYCYWLQKTEYRSNFNPGPNTFFWASYCFLYGWNTVRQATGHQYYYGDTTHCAIDSHTFIHEMGHVFGLDDYYDYGPNKYSPAGSFSMQDHNVGGHDPFSLMAFGWADPYIPTDSCEIKLRPFATTNDVILLTPQWNEFDSPFDEYLLLELFAPIGTNEFDCLYGYGGDNPGPSMTGVRVWHVDARLIHCETVSGNVPVFGNDFITDVEYKSIYGVKTAFTNSVGNEAYGSPLGSAYDKYDLLHLIRNSRSARRLNKSGLSNNDLFRNGDTFTMEDFKAQFAENGKLDSGIDLGWNFLVNIEGSGANAVATITLNQE